MSSLTQARIWQRILSTGSAHAIAGLCGITVFTIALLITFIFVTNDGIFTYTLDDPYIHLQLAASIAKGHYGLQLGEYAAPSSSILWPFLLAPFAYLPFFTYAPLFLNILSATGIIVTSYGISRHIIADRSDGKNIALKRAGIVGGILLLTNTIGLIFSGMENALQVWMILLGLLGLFKVSATGRAPWWCIMALILGPTIRYETLAFSLLGCLFLWVQKQKKAACVTLFFIILSVGGFSYFLHSLQLGWLPSSVLTKWSVTSLNQYTDHSTRYLILFLSQLGFALLQAFPVNLFFIVLLPTCSYLVYRLYHQDDRRHDLLAIAIIVWGVVCAHALFGSYSNSGGLRYISYIIALLYPSILAIYARFPLLYKTHADSISMHARALMMLGVVISLFTINHICLIPTAANNIYQQQYQMARFVKEYYKKPVGINDLGLVSLNNPYFVLDYVGLGSDEVRKLLLERKASANWMDTLAAKHHVGLVMIYDKWFSGEIPSYWHKLATLTVSNQRINLGGRTVTFYRTHYETDPERLDVLLQQFAKILPPAVTFEREDH